MIDINELIELIQEDDHAGVCLGCGEIQYGCEPDARKCTCESCGEPKVYGAEEALIMIG